MLPTSSLFSQFPTLTRGQHRITSHNLLANLPWDLCSFLIVLQRLNNLASTCLSSFHPSPSSHIFPYNCERTLPPIKPPEHIDVLFISTSYLEWLSLCLFYLCILDCSSMGHPRPQHCPPSSGH